MMPKGKRVAITAAVCGIAILAMTAFLERDRIAEEWWLWRLSRASTVPEEIKPVERLGKLRSVRAVPLIFDRMRERGEELGNGFSEMRDALILIGPSAVPYLIRALDHQDEDTRKLSFGLLRVLGPQARDAIPALIAKVRDPSCEERDRAVSALAKIGPPATVIPVLTSVSKDENAPELLRDIAAEAIKEVSEMQDGQD